MLAIGFALHHRAVAPEEHAALGGTGTIHILDLLGDDRALVRLRVYAMRGGADDIDPAGPTPGGTAWRLCKRAGMSGEC